MGANHASMGAGNELERGTRSPLEAVVGSPGKVHPNLHSRRHELVSMPFEANAR